MTMGIHNLNADKQSQSMTFWICFTFHSLYSCKGKGITRGKDAARGWDR